MAETTPLLPPASSGPSRRLRTSAAAAVIGLLLALVLVASLSASKSPVALESDGEHDSALILLRLRCHFISPAPSQLTDTRCPPVEEHLAKNIYAMSGKSYFPTNPKIVTKSTSPSTHARVHLLICRIIPPPQSPPALLCIRSASNSAPRAAKTVRRAD